MIAYGAALSLDKMFADSKPKDVNKMLVILEDAQKDHSHVSGEIAKPFFESKEEENAFKEAHKKKQVHKKNPEFLLVHLIIQILLWYFLHQSQENIEQPLLFVVSSMSPVSSYVLL